MIFERFFKKSKEVDENLKQDENNYLEEYLKIKNEINHIESKYDDMVLRSLELDFDDFKRLIDSGVIIRKENYEFWHFEKIEYSEFRLVKYSKIQYGEKYVNLDVKFSFYDEFKLEKVSLDFTILDEKKFKNILESYFIYYKLNEIKKSKQRTLDKYDKVISIIGKDVKRDSIIDQLLNGE
jgi:hypothetical protein